MGITQGLSTVVTTPPYLHDEADKLAVIQSIKNMQVALASSPNITWALPPKNQTVEDYVTQYVVTAAARRANHWMGRYHNGNSTSFPCTKSG